MNTFAFGASDAMNALLYPAKHPGTVSFLQNTIDSARNLIVDQGRNFWQRSQAAFNHFNGDGALRYARKIASSIQGAFEVPRIVEYDTLSQFQQASILMQRWIMANPTVRQMYTQQRLDGYADTYVDMQPGAIGETHYDYRRVMNGLVVEKEDSWTATQYLDELKEGDRELILEEQSVVIEGWTKMDLLLALCKDDPTSPTGGQL